MTSYRATITGQVQGLGFRPYVYRMAVLMGVRGTVANSSRGVEIVAQGQRARAFLERLSREPPPLARISTFRVEKTGGPKLRVFKVIPSRSRKDAGVDVLPDIATCADCRREVFDRRDRRRGYAFTNCTQCGPRYTIIEGLPYDRPATTMSRFGMCGDCSREYREPADRRFHAQPNACPSCGPLLSLLDRHGNQVSGDPIQTAAEMLAGGGVVAIKSLGGFQLACDATRDGPVKRLRLRKSRPYKPLAVMCQDPATAALVGRVGRQARSLLVSPAAPIVLLPKRTSPKLPLSVLIAPANGRLGVMLAYTPLHHLLLRAVADITGNVPVLVMTSANLREEPILHTAEEVLSQLGGVADLVLTHDREIANRCDDSVVLTDSPPVIVRRARGYAPQPVILGKSFHVKHPALALGGELRNCFALAGAGKVYLSPHLGNLSSPEAELFLDRTLDRFLGWTGVRPERVACDLHPDYLSTRLAERLARKLNLPLLRIQHHHAHAVSVMAEHDIRETALALVFDGTGYGADGSVWGCEFLVVHPDLSWRRVGHLGTLRLVQGVTETPDPGRIAAAYLLQAFGSVPSRLGLSRQAASARQLLNAGETVPTSSLGRLFDAVAGITGICRRATFEGQAAVALEAAAAPGRTGHYESRVLDTVGTAQIDTAGLVRSVLSDVLAGSDPADISARFHNTVVRVATRLARRLAEEHDTKLVVLSGGSFQNDRLRQGIEASLGRRGLLVHRNSLVPTNDGGISLGQAVVAGSATS